jgi:hypothetical protein
MSPALQPWCLKWHLAFRELECIFSSFIDASMVIEGVKQFQEKEALIAALKIIALGEKERIHGEGISAGESREQH